jgi:hypothetical protein
MPIIGVGTWNVRSPKIKAQVNHLDHWHINTSLH